MKYYKSLDAYRCICILFVFVSHFVGIDYPVPYSIGITGVDMFFVLSGFLITGILIDYKDQYSLKEGFIKFYTRRALRIFPIYYLWILVTVLATHDQVPHDQIRATLLYYANFKNLAMLNSGSHVHMSIDHFWSLSVEEQFYLVWPFILFIIPTKRMLPLFISVIALGLGFGIYAYISSGNIYNMRFHTLACSLLLSTGALLAYYYKTNNSIILPILKYSKYIVYCCLLLWISITWMHTPVDSIWGIIWRLCTAVASFALIIYLTRTDYDRLPAFFRNNFVQYIGRISYGLYVYHFLIVYKLNPYINNIAIRAVVYTLLTFTIAHFSFKYIETPLLRLKKKQ